MGVTFAPPHTGGGTQTGAPAALLTTAEAKLHLRVTHSTEDTPIDALVNAATQFIEQHTLRALVTQTWTVLYDNFGGSLNSRIVLPRSPAASVTSVKYQDATDTQQTVTGTDYMLLGTMPSQIALVNSATWPTVLDEPEAVEVIYIAGAAAADVPQVLKQAVLMLVEHWYENRGPTVQGTVVQDLPFAIQNIITAYKVENPYGRE